MFNATEVLIDAFVNRVREGYHRTYGSLKTDYQDIIAWVGSMALERKSCSPSYQTSSIFNLNYLHCSPHCLRQVYIQLYTVLQGRSTAL